MKNTRYKKKGGLFKTILVFLVLITIVGAFASLTNGFKNWNYNSWEVGEYSTVDSTNVEYFKGKDGFEVKGGLTFDEEANLQVAVFKYYEKTETKQAVVNKNKSGTAFNLVVADEVLKVSEFKSSYELVSISDYTAFNNIFKSPYINTEELKIESIVATLRSGKTVTADKDFVFDLKQGDIISYIDINFNNTFAVSDGAGITYTVRRSLTDANQVGESKLCGELLKDYITGNSLRIYIDSPYCDFDTVGLYQIYVQGSAIQNQLGSGYSSIPLYIIFNVVA